jgi:hypothetical protein
MRQTILIGIFPILLFSSGISAETSEWKLEHNKNSTSVETTATAEINYELRVEAVLRLQCNKNMATLGFEIADFQKAQNVFDLDNFEGPSAPARNVPLTFIDLVSAQPTQSSRFTQNGFYSVEPRFAFTISQVEANSVALAQLYRQMVTEGNLLRIRIRSFQDPYRFIIAEFPLSGSRKAIASLTSTCPNPKSPPPKPAKGK